MSDTDEPEVYAVPNGDEWRQVGLLFRGDELTPEIADGDLLLLDEGCCPWRPRGQWQPGPAVVWAEHGRDRWRIVRRLEWSPDGWLLTANGCEPVPLAEGVQVIAQVLGIYVPMR